MKWACWHPPSVSLACLPCQSEVAVPRRAALGYLIGRGALMGRGELIGTGDLIGRGSLIGAGAGGRSRAPAVALVVSGSKKAWLGTPRSLVTTGDVAQW